MTREGRADHTMNRRPRLLYGRWIWRKEWKERDFMKHVKQVTVAKAQFFEDTGLNQPITFWVWLGSIYYVLKEYNNF